MTAESKPVAQRSESSELDRAVSDALESVSKALNGPGKELPMQLFRASVAHARAVIDRQHAEEHVRDVEDRIRRIEAAPFTVQPEAAKHALADLENSRSALRSALFAEAIHRGGLDAVRARVDLIVASTRRQADMHIATAITHSDGNVPSQDVRGAAR